MRSLDLLYTLYISTCMSYRDDNIVFRIFEYEWSNINLKLYRVISKKVQRAHQKLS